MNETGKSYQVSKIFDVLIRNSLERVLVGFVDYCRKLCKRETDAIFARIFKNSDSNMFLKEDQILYVKTERLKKPVKCSKHFSTNGKSDGADSLSTEDNMLKSDHSIRNLQYDNFTKCPQTAKLTFLNIVAAKLCKVSKVFDIDQDVSLEYNGHAFSNTGTQIDILDVSSSSLRISERNSHVRSISVFSDEFLRKFCFFINPLNFLSGNFKNYFSDKLPNSLNSQHSKEASVTTDENMNQLQPDLKSSQNANTEIHQDFPTRDLETPEVTMIPGKDSKSLNTDIENSYRESEICQLEFPVIDPEFTEEKCSGLDYVLSWEIETFTASDTAMMIDDPCNFYDENGQLNSSKCSEDINTDKQNHFQSFDSIPYKTETCSSRNSDYCLSNFKLSDNDTESNHSDLMFSESDNESNSNRLSNEYLHAPKDSQNVFNTISEKEVLIDEEFSDFEFISNGDQLDFSSTLKSEENWVSTNSINTDNEAEGLEASSKQTSILTRLLNEPIKMSKFYNPYATLSNTGSDPMSQEQSDDILKKVQNPLNTHMVDPLRILEQVIISRLSSGTEKLTIEQNILQVSPLTEQENIEIQKMLEHVLNNAEECQGITSKKPISKHSKEKSTSSHKKIHNVISENCVGRNSIDNSQATQILKENCFRGGNTSFIEDQYSNENSNPYKSGVKISNGDQKPLTFKQSSGNAVEALDNLLNSVREKKRKNDFLIEDLAFDSDRSFLDSIEKDNDRESILDIFKSIIKLHPLKKPEIPACFPRNLVKLENNNIPKLASNALQLHAVNDHPDIECYQNIDSSSIMSFDVTDCFNQNSSIICESLIKDYLDISAKVDLLLAKQIRNISKEEYESRIHYLHSLDDELGYIGAKLMTTINDWIKQFDEIERNVLESKTGSRDLYHMGILKICGCLVYMLLTFTLEKQLELENYERFLIFHNKGCN